VVHYGAKQNSRKGLRLLTRGRFPLLREFNWYDTGKNWEGKKKRPKGYRCVGRPASGRGHGASSTHRRLAYQRGAKKPFGYFKGLSTRWGTEVLSSP